MKIRERLIIIWNIVVLSTAVLAFSVTKAWFLNGNEFGNNTLEASSVSNYFAAGDGTEQNPYIIKDPIHMYNLSWLQARGIFDDAKYYFKVANLDGSPTTIDFAGALSGTTGKTGAIPPIGTDGHHFIGEFDGNGSVIKNIWVSSDPNDWAEKPIDIGDANTNTHVGFFGNIDQNDQQQGVVKNFYLENIEVTSHVSGSYVGLIAGYSNSYTQSIGVKNGKLSYRGGGSDSPNSYMSEASLIGKIGDLVNWVDMPSDNAAGGVLKVDPNDVTGQTNLASGSTQAAAGSTTGTAYLSGLINYSSVSGGFSTVHKYNTPLSFSNNYPNGVALNLANSTEASGNNTGICSTQFWQCYNKKGKRTLSMSAMPSINPTSSVTANGNTFTIPRNCIWFKPQQGGTCGISFTVGNMPDSRFVSIYRFKRTKQNESDAVPTVIPSVSTWDEIILVFQKGTDPIGNKRVLYYEIEITNEEAKAGYEYCIGLSSKRTDNSTGNIIPADFVFLYLAGASNTGGNSNATATLNKLDYVYKNGDTFLPSFNVEKYIPHKTMLTMPILNARTDAFACYNMDDITNSTYVYYYVSNLPITDTISTSVSVGRKETTLGRFPSRQQT